jgi:hypothetical protein
LLQDSAQGLEQFSFDRQHIGRFYEARPSRPL